MRVKSIIAYDGSRFFGFQSQKHTQKTVADTLQKALKSLQIHSKITASGRTDTGVHATAQVIHFDLPSYWSDLEKLKLHLNHRLFPYIRIKKIAKVSEDFHARYNAKRRAYRYILCEQEPNPFESNYVTFVKNIDFEKIKEAITLFEGRYDFKYFQKSGSDIKSSVREIYKAKLYKYKDYKILYFEANGFLRSQIRIMVDFLLKIGKGKIGQKELKEQLLCKKKHSTSLAPPYGLYLCKVIYN